VKLKLFTILLLIVAIAVASLFGTLSSYTVSSQYEIGIVPNMQRTPTPVEPSVTPSPTPSGPIITPSPTPAITATPSPTPAASPVPDLNKLSGEYILQGMIVNKQTVVNDKGFVMITGNLKEKNQAATLYFGNSDNSMTPYLLYFSKNTKIQFTDGSYAVLTGFYTIAAGHNRVNLFSPELYNWEGGMYTVKPNNGGRLIACSDAQAIALCAQRGIPLQ